MDKDGECITNQLYNDQKDKLKIVENVDCGAKKGQYTCVSRQVGNEYLCTRCSNNKGCQAVSFYTATNTSKADIDSGKGCSAEPLSGTKVSYLPDPNCGKALGGKDTTPDNSTCSCETPQGKMGLGGQCVDKCPSGTSGIENAMGCASGKVCCSKTPAEKSQAKCETPNTCEEGTTCTTGGKPTGASCVTGKVCCAPAANKAAGTCASPNTCVPVGRSTPLGATASCMINNQPVNIDCTNKQQIGAVCRVTGITGQQQDFSLSCSLVVPNYLAGQQAMGQQAMGQQVNNGCSNGGTPVGAGGCPASQICCAPVSIWDGLIRSLTTSVGTLMNRIISPIASIGTPSISTPTTSTTNTASSSASITSSTAPAVTGSLNSDNGVDVTFNIKLKFQGITKSPKPELNKMNVKVSIVDTEAVTTSTKTAVQTGEFTASGGAGIWTGSVTFTKVEPKKGYYLLVKGPKHVQKKICTNSPTETAAGSYFCDDLLNIVAGTNNLDLTKIYMMAGDVPKQDGAVNSVDFGAIRTRFGKLDYTSLETADINLDGAVNSQDFSLIIQTLQTTDGNDQK